MFMPGVVTLPQLATKFDEYDGRPVEYDEYDGRPVIFPLSIDVFYNGILLLYSDGSVVKYNWNNGIRDFGPIELYHVVYTPGCQLPLAVAVAAGRSHDCVLLIDGQVKCWFLVRRPFFLPSYASRRWRAGGERHHTPSTRGRP